MIWASNLFWILRAPLTGGLGCAAAHLDDHRHAFGQPPGEEPPGRGDYRQRHAWEQVHDAATKALEMHPERPVVERPPPQLQRDIGLDIGR